MQLKRSVSPDGRIDSLSVEFSAAVDETSPEAVRSSAARILSLQNDVVADFLGKNGKAQEKAAVEEKSDGTLPAQMIDIGGMDGKWGRRLFINVRSNGQTLRLYGNRKQLGEYLVMIGFPKLSGRIEEGISLDVPCRVTTEPSRDGRFTNIVKVLPAANPVSQKRARP